MSVKRYDVMSYSLDADGNTGPFVKYEDYAALEARCAALAAENAGLLAAAKYFSYSETSGFEKHSTAELAMKSAADDLFGEREEALSEGWSEETGTICWGVIVQKAEEGQFEEPSEANGWIGWSEYSLSPSIETPATSAFLAEVRASGVEQLAIHMELNGYSNEAAGAREYAANLRKGVQS